MQSICDKSPGQDWVTNALLFIAVTADVAFRWVFGQETNKDLLIALLNEFIPDRSITDIALYKDTQIPFSKELKKSVFDVSCRTGDGTYIDVEVQVAGQSTFADRCLYYSSFNIQGQIPEGAREYALKPVYVISIDNFIRRHGQGWEPDVLSSYSLREDSTHELMTDTLHFIFVELPLFTKSWEELENDRERFYFCLKHLHELKHVPDSLKEGVFLKLAGQAKLNAMSADVKRKYISNMTTEIDRSAQLLYAERKGREKGLAEGKAEAILEAAQKLKAAGVPIDIICQCTGLSREQVEG